MGRHWAGNASGQREPSIFDASVPARAAAASRSVTRLNFNALQRGPGGSCDEGQGMRATTCRHWTDARQKIDGAALAKTGCLAWQADSGKGSISSPHAVVAANGRGSDRQGQDPPGGCLKRSPAVAADAFFADGPAFAVVPFVATCA